MGVMSDVALPGAREALAMLPARVSTAAQLGARWQLPSGAATVVVGAGGSHPAAEFIARLLRDRGTVARAAYPLDAGGPERQMVAVSYSGSTPDVAESIRRFRLGGGEHVLLITGAERAHLRRNADVTLCHRGADDARMSAQPERGFMSFASTVAPCAASAAALLPYEQVAAAWAARSVQLEFRPGMLRQSCARALSGGEVDVLASGWAWPAALDLESKWAESGLGPLRVHETKNFSHGRYISVLDRGSRRHSSIVLRDGDAGPYDDELLRQLSGQGPLLVLRTELCGPVGALALLTASQPLAVLVGELRGQDISRPAIPDGGVLLHRWPWDSSSDI